MKWLPYQRLPGKPAAPAAASSMASMLSKQMTEIRRMDQQHAAMRNEMQGNFLAPLSAPSAILDVGCGTARWVMEVAQQFPGAEVIGIDAIPPIPSVSFGRGIDHLPPNAKFLPNDILQRLPFADGAFDFVHMRFMYPFIPAQGWEALFLELARVTKRGGWIESVEPLPYAVQQKKGMTTIFMWFCEVLRRQDADPFAVLKITQMMKTLGLDPVTTRQIGQSEYHTQDAEEAALRRKNCLLFIDLARDAIVAAGVVSAAEFDQMAGEAKEDLQFNQHLHCYDTFVNFGQRR
jgi:ubiquinone/menaquinone biosynthesis C-methylase UbiE